MQKKLAENRTVSELHRRGREWEKKLNFYIILVAFSSSSSSSFFPVLVSKVVILVFDFFCDLTCFFFGSDRQGKNRTGKKKHFRISHMFACIITYYIAVKTKCVSCCFRTRTDWKRTFL